MIMIFAMLNPGCSAASAQHPCCPSLHSFIAIVETRTHQHGEINTPTKDW